jgi:hypothetical protein
LAAPTTKATVKSTPAIHSGRDESPTEAVETGRAGAAELDQGAQAEGEDEIDRVEDERDVAISLA